MSLLMDLLYAAAGAVAWPWLVRKSLRTGKYQRGHFEDTASGYCGVNAVLLLEHARATGDKARLSRCLPVLVKLYDWLKANRRREDIGLYWFELPGASGMDNAPRGGADLHGSGMAHVDLSAQQVLSAGYLAQSGEDVGDVRLLGLAQRGLHADEDRILLSQSGETAGRQEAAA